jgi:hypothetical protein
MSEINEIIIRTINDIGSESIINELPINQPSEKYMKYLIKTTFISCFRSTNPYVKYISFSFLNLIILGSLFCVYWYPNYYLSQPVVWTLDLLILYITFNYIFYLIHTDYDNVIKGDEYDIIPWKRNTNLFFYCIFMIYWFYFAIVQFYSHSEPNALIQLGNIYMSISWYLFFSKISFLYYYICNRLLQRSEQIRDWLKKLKKKYKNQSIELKHDDSEFYNEYNKHYSKIKNFSKYWNFLIFIGFILLIAHIPIDLISIIYLNQLFDIPGVIIKTSALIWYLYCICQLNDYEDKIIPYLYKHRIYDDDQIEYISKYIKYRPLGLNFYGIKISGSYLIKYLIIGLNLLIPTLYALLSKSINFK